METTMLKDALTVIQERKSVRNYTGETVSKKDIEKILRAAMAAPAAVHLMPWKYVVVSERAMLKKLSDHLPHAKMLQQAGTGIVVCVSPAEAASQSEIYAILDGACASENILLAAEALGLGAVWTALYPNKELMNFVRNELDIPQNVIPLNLIPIGHPTGEDKPQKKYNAQNIHWDVW
jgi:nitroreductase